LGAGAGKHSNGALPQSGGALRRAPSSDRAERAREIGDQIGARLEAHRQAYEIVVGIDRGALLGAEPTVSAGASVPRGPLAACNDCAHEVGLGPFRLVHREARRGGC
jgi:hypothetical protein